MDVQGIHNGFQQYKGVTKEVREAREQRLAAHEALPKVKSPEEARKLIDEVRNLLLYG
ncbi:hypothetical protein HY522_11930 [bacterium]|nr:hypothetical protein [bacterium]